MKIVVYSLGCKVNQYESDALISALKKLGHEVTNELEKADIYILNTCAVTNEAEKKSRQMIAKFNALNENARVLVCGCASEKDSKQFVKLKNVHFVSGTTNKIKLVESLDRDGVEVEALSPVYENLTIDKASNTRAFVKIQDGCNNFCSYCIIPYLRGRSRSRDIVSILKEIDLLTAPSLEHMSANEIVLTGINLADFRIDSVLGMTTLLKQLENCPARIRLGSMEVDLITEEFLTQAKSMVNFCPHFHLSMQSGANSVLKRMNRHYTVRKYLKAVKLIRKYFPDANITTDVIVGFAGETPSEFRKTVRTIKKAKFGGMHIFPYSVRTGTVAEKMITSGKWKLLNGKEVKKRAEKLNELAKELKVEYIKKCVGKEFVLLIEEVKDEYFVGTTENYLKCYLKAQGLDYNSLYVVRVIEPFKDGALVELV